MPLHLESNRRESRKENQEILVKLIFTVCVRKGEVKNAWLVPHLTHRSCWESCESRYQLFRRGASGFERDLGVPPPHMSA